MVELWGHIGTVVQRGLVGAVDPLSFGADDRHAGLHVCPLAGGDQRPHGGFTVARVSDVHLGKLGRKRLYYRGHQRFGG